MEENSGYVVTVVHMNDDPMTADNAVYLNHSDGSSEVIDSSEGWTTYGNDGALARLGWKRVGDWKARGHSIVEAPVEPLSFPGR